MGSMVHDKNEPCAVIAHRHELVSQISLAMAKFGIPHRIIASKNTVQHCISVHIRELGRSFHDARSMVTVAGVDTLIARSDELMQWARTVRHWMIDECHHVLAGNKWGRAVAMFPNAEGTGFTATPLRADRKSLHHEQGGVFEHMVLGPTMRHLIKQGSLCDYRIFAPTMSIDRDAIKVGASGDFSAPSMRKQAHESQIVGDVVKHYLRIAPGLRGITFAVDVEHAVEIAGKFRDEGVPAEPLSAKTPDSVRDQIMRKFVEGKILQIVNVDLFGEGVDVPAVEVVSMARPTESLGLYIQQFGRVLRTMDHKSHGIVIDHVGNVKRHGLPDAPRNWTLWAEERGKKRQRDDDVMPVTTCTACFQMYEATHSACPFCGHKPDPEARSHPKFVDGDLEELDAETLAAMRGEIEDIDRECPIEAKDPRTRAMAKNWTARQDAQKELRHAIALWAGVWRDRGAEDSAIYRRFYHTFQTDVMSAQTLGTADAKKLKERIKNANFAH